MSGILSHFACCFWWFLLGVLVGWLLNRWLCSCSCTKNSDKDAPPEVSEIEAEPSKDSKVSSPSPSKSNVQSLTSTGFDAVAAKAAGFSIKNADDLTVIEGIGPKISQLFKQNGVVTFNDLSKQSLDQMRTVLDKGGARFRIANPSTWARQASLAAKNDWLALKKLQDELSGGVKK